MIGVWAAGHPTPSRPSTSVKHTNLTLADRAESLSPSPFRLALDLKGIPYKTEWVEYPDIEPLCKRIGAPPTSKTDDGRDHYTLPVIFDPRTGKVISDSLFIAMYLDDAYPDSGPALFPAQTRALQVVFANWIGPAVVLKARAPLLQHIVALLAPPSEAYFRKTREMRFGMALEDIAPLGSDKRANLWKEVERGLDEVDTALGHNGQGKTFVMGDTPSFADVIIASMVLWIKVCGLPVDWERISGWHGGRWVRLAEKAQAYGKN